MPSHTEATTHGLQATTRDVANPSGPQHSDSATAFVKSFFEHRAPEVQNRGSTTAVTESDPRIRNAYADAEVAWYRYQADGFRFRMRAFERQYTLSLWIFIVVVILVLSGVIFAAFQLFAGLFPRSKLRGTADGADATKKQQTLTSTAGAAKASGDAPIASVPSADAGRSQPTESRFEETEIQLSPTSFVVKTSILGIVVLAISCAFFFLYLKFVYPIQNSPW